MREAGWEMAVHDGDLRGIVAPQEFSVPNSLGERRIEIGDYRRGRNGTT
jgi:hypothetical protein